MFVSGFSRRASRMNDRTWRMLKKHLHLHPWEVTSKNELKVGDSAKRAEYCWWFRDVITANAEDILDVTFITHRAHIHISGYVSSQNSPVWSPTNPHDITDTPLRDQKVGVRCAISWYRIIDPYSSMRLLKRNFIVKWFFTSSLDI
jgi:hypothetical protein